MKAYLNQVGRYVWVDRVFSVKQLPLSLQGRRIVVFCLSTHDSLLATVAEAGPAICLWQRQQSASSLFRVSRMLVFGWICRTVETRERGQANQWTPWRGQWRETRRHRQEQGGRVATIKPTPLHLHQLKVKHWKS